MPQKPSASSHDRQLNEKPSYSWATSTSLGRNEVRVQRCADWPSTCGSWVIVVWSQSVRSMIWVPTASNSTGFLGMSLATSTAETITATAPSHGTSQSYSPNGVVIIRAFR